MSVFFISDLHLNEQSTDSYNLFIKFFNNIPSSTQAVYILGDLFEIWVDDRVSNQFLDNVKNILKQATEKFPVYFISGNRDFLIGEYFAAQTNIKILPDIYKLKLYNQDVLLVHGDCLCSLDRKHIYFTKIIRHPITIGLANILPVKLKLNIANKIRSISKHKYKKNNFNVRDLSIYDVCPNTVNHIVRQHSANILIHGHTHKPNIHNDHNFTRIVLGDWHDSAKILVFNPEGYQLTKIF